MEFIENSSEYACDIELFKEYWGNLGSIPFLEYIDALSEIKEAIESKKLNFRRRYSIDNYWEEAKDIIFYEDVKFTLSCLNKLKNGERITFVQCPDFPNMVVREKLLVEFIRKSIHF